MSSSLFSQLALLYIRKGRWLIHETETSIDSSVEEQFCWRWQFTAHWSIKVGKYRCSYFKFSLALLQNLSQCLYCSLHSTIALMKVWARSNMFDFKLVTELVNFFRNETWSIVRDDLFGETNFSEIIVETSNHCIITA